MNKMNKMNKITKRIINLIIWSIYIVTAGFNVYLFSIVNYNIGGTLSYIILLGNFGVLILLAMFYLKSVEELK